METLIKSIKQALFIDNQRSLTQVSLLCSGYPYAVGGYSKYDIPIAVAKINSEGLFKPLKLYYNSYGIMTVSI